MEQHRKSDKKDNKEVYNKMNKPKSLHDFLFLSPYKTGFPPISMVLDNYLKKMIIIVVTAFSQARGVHLYGTLFIQ